MALIRARFLSLLLTTIHGAMYCGTNYLSGAPSMAVAVKGCGEPIDGTHPKS